MRKKYNTPHRRHVVKTRMTDEEYADFTGRLAAYEISQSEFIRQAIRKATIRPIVTVSPVNDGLLAALSKLTAEYGKIGGNLNQIARSLNEYGSPYRGLEKEVRGAAADLAALKFEVLQKVGEAVGDVANEPKVSFRNGQFIVTDGQHTIEGRILRNGGKDLPILCKVYTGMTVEQEALLFAEQNGFSAPLTAGIKLRAKVVGGDAISKAFLAATNRVGLSLNYDSQQLTDYRIGCVGTAFRLYKQMGEPLYCETMRLIVAAWEGKPDSFRASVLKGMMHFVELYHGEFSEERLLRALRNIHPVDIYRIGQDDPAKLRGWKKYVFPIYTAYNGKCRKDALPMKF